MLNGALSIEVDSSEENEKILTFTNIGLAIMSLAQEIISVISQVHWTGFVPGVVSHLSMMELADLFLEEWLTDSHVDTILVILEKCLYKHSAHAIVISLNRLLLPSLSVPAG
ncbi:hypothetical protein BDQ17DRAFT_1436230 [Cyathus striatus]|nr:hypothetical protein BDQ17DRAFT_1436230 [Cyathus striatus]